MPENSSQTIRFKYVFPDDYNPDYANGVIGGVTPHGEILMHFYQERHALPREAVHELVDGQIGKSISKEEGDVIAIRFIQGGVSLTPNTARMIHEWLGEHLARLDQSHPGAEAPASGGKEDAA